MPYQQYFNHIMVATIVEKFENKIIRKGIKN